MESHLPHVGRSTKGGSLHYNSWNGNGAKAPRVTIEFPGVPVRRVPGWKPALDIALHSARATDLVAADDLAHAGDAFRLAGTDFLPTETRWTWWKTFSYLEVPNHEG